MAKRLTDRQVKEAIAQAQKALDKNNLLWLVDADSGNIFYKELYGPRNCYSTSQILYANYGSETKRLVLL